VNYNALADVLVTVTVERASKTFVALGAMNTTYTATLRLLDLALPSGYEWAIPATALSAGNGQTFAAIYTDPSGNYTAANGSVTVNIAKASGAAVGTPVLASATSSSITIDAVNAPAGQTVEYAKNTTSAVPSTGWQSTLTFTGLSPSATYYIFARSAENANYNAGTALSLQTATSSNSIGGGGGGITNPNDSWTCTGCACTNTCSTPAISQIKPAASNRIAQNANGISLAVESDAVVAIYGLNGSLVSRQGYASGEYSISLGSLPKGMYIVKVSFDNHSSGSILRVVVK